MTLENRVLHPLSLKHILKFRPLNTLFSLMRREGIDMGFLWSSPTLLGPSTIHAHWAGWNMASLHQTSTGCIWNLAVTIPLSHPCRLSWLSGHKHWPNEWTHVPLRPGWPLLWTWIGSSSSVCLHLHMAYRELQVKKLDLLDLPPWDMSWFASIPTPSLRGTSRKWQI